MRAFLFIFLFLANSAYCQEDQAHLNKNTSFTLAAVKVKSWKSSAPLSAYTSYVDFFSGGKKQLLVWQNSAKSSLDFYQWDKPKLTYTINAKAALKEHGRMQGFYIASPDSVYILDASNSRLHLINKKGKLLNTHSWMAESGSGRKVDQLMAGIYSGNPGIRQQDWLLMSCVPFSGSSDPITFTEGKISLALNLKTGETRFEYAYPPIYADGNYAQYYLDINRCLTGEGKFLYSFGPEDSVRLSDLKGPDKMYYAGSSYFESPPPAIPELGNPSKPQSFGGILYDKANQVYYRMALHGLDDVLNAEFGFDDQVLSIIILDKDFKKIGETMLPRGKHNFRQWFVGPDGLYISNHHPSQLNSAKREISFTHYKLMPAE